MTPATLEIKKTVQEIQKLYKEDSSQQTFNCLVMGGVGVGKTVLSETLRRPVLFHSFDPGGTKSIKEELIKSGAIIPDIRWENTDNPDNFTEWEKSFKSLVASGALQFFGSYVIDSFTNLLGSCITNMVKKMGRANGVLALSDWQLIRNSILSVVRRATVQKCDFLLTAHLKQVQDTVTGSFTTTIDAPPSLQQALLLLFDELYILEAKKTPKGIERSLLTSADGKYQCRTRIGRDKFELREPVNIKALLKKAGFPTDDKEPIT